jgi:hypothetical protein
VLLPPATQLKTHARVLIQRVRVLFCSLQDGASRQPVVSLSLGDACDFCLKVCAPRKARSLNRRYACIVALAILPMLIRARCATFTKRALPERLEFHALTDFIFSTCFVLRVAVLFFLKGRAPRSAHHRAPRVWRRHPFWRARAVSWLRPIAKLALQPTMHLPRTKPTTLVCYFQPYEQLSSRRTFV